MRKIIVAAGVAAGAVLFFPAVASAGSPGLSVSVSGTTATLHGTCVGNNVVAEGNYGIRNGHEPYGAGVMKADGHRQTITFENIKPGKYIAFMFCHDQKDGNSTVVDFIIPGKPAPRPATAAPQVAKKPQGAPQTGGGPGDDEGGIGPLVVGGSAAGVAAVAGAGFWLRRRRRV
ncbi:hypothetical protein [Amycolatopsis australiensis]|uniref:MYXO-CTERM domain-containing protein n=1 Tax=Amycolatopsis australiensis TaxID=546364 RepID=A0A1K1QWC3_9PSEU|nr:hypothetical protein [Amycolatopsis australiensis]SFW64012.1 hypothetical protein SAMN04489730_2312 [Amycolatopsis australiensis]